jgi:putative chitobiose transport system permease protein
MSKEKLITKFLLITEFLKNFSKNISKDKSIKNLHLVLPFLLAWLIFNVLSIINALMIITPDLSKNLQYVLKDSLFWVSLKNSLMYCLVVIPLQITAFSISFMLYSLSEKIVSFFRVILYFPVVVPIASIGFVFKFMFNDEGFINELLSSTIGIKVPFLSNYYFSMLTAFALTMWKGLGYYIVIYLSALYSIPKEIIENSIIDNMNLLQRLWYIYIPMLKETFFFATFLSTLAALKVFAEIFILTEGGPGTSTFTLMMYTYSKAFQSLDIKAAITTSFILSIMAIIISLFVFKKQIQKFNTPYN